MIAPDPKTGRWRGYPSYSDSGREWLGDVPAHWPCVRIKTTVASEQNGVWGDEPTGEDDWICVRVADFDRAAFVVNDASLTVRSVTKTHQKSRGLRPGDLLIEKSGGGDNQPVGAVVRYTLPLPAVCSNFVARLRVAPDNDATFLTYLHAALYTARVNTRSIKQSTGIQNLDTAAYFAEKVYLPKVVEQRAIAAFLDEKTARIDELIAKKERLIELLQEKRTALITRAVTNGLDPHVPMKNSGVEWLGEVPAHWEVGSLRRWWVVIDCKHRTVPFVDQGRPVASIGEVRGFEVDLSSAKKTTPDEWAIMREGGRDPREGDLVFARNATVGACSLVGTGEAFCLGQDVCLIRGPAGRFLNYLIHSRVVGAQLEVAQIGSTFNRINISAIRQLALVRPSEIEMSAVATFLDRETARIDSLVDKVREAIDRLREYRTALISAAVTGKIDVRDAA